METCKTVKVVSDVAPGDYIVINESDLTEAHTLFAEEEAEGADPDAAAKTKVKADATAKKAK